ncbi:MAG: hypothetical protein JNK54_03175 [Elusimicrobia bacterium]|nr:hypothetical protein [Elusimicrobiota bacterium]
MKTLKILLAVCLIGAAAACSRNSKDKFFGTDTPSSSDAAVPDTNLTAAPVEEQLMNKVATGILAEITGSNIHALSAPSALSNCSPGDVTFSSTTYHYPPAVHGSSQVYTVNGTTYFSANNYTSSGGTLVFLVEKNGTCLKNSSIYGTLSVTGSSYTQWADVNYQLKYRYYYYKYNYNYKGDLLVIDGSYTIGSETGTTQYPFKWTINI